MNEAVSVLLVGETWFYNTTEFKGFDCFSVSGYEKATQWIQSAFNKDGYEFHHIAAHEIHEKFPSTIDGMRKYDVILISDVGANSFLLHPDTFYRSIYTVNKLKLIKEYVGGGGGFGMIGGYLTFQGIEGKGKYKGSVIEEILPVKLLSGDDRVEVPEGCVLKFDQNKHPVLSGFPSQSPCILGYNKLIAKDGTEVLADVEGDPIISLSEYGKGRTLAFATDCAPHWATPAFCEWEYYGILWRRLASWLAQK